MRRVKSNDPCRFCFWVEKVRAGVLRIVCGFFFLMPFCCGLTAKFFICPKGSGLPIFDAPVVGMFYNFKLNSVDIHFLSPFGVGRFCPSQYIILSVADYNPFFKLFASGPLAHDWPA